MCILPFEAQIKHTTRTIERNHAIKAEVTFCVRGVISPLLANLFLHYAFDAWMSRTYPHIPFEKYADDAICHCKRASGAIDRSPGEVLKPVGILGVALLTGGGHPRGGRSRTRSNPPQKEGRSPHTDSARPSGLYRGGSCC